MIVLQCPHGFTHPRYCMVCRAGQDAAIDAQLGRSPYDDFHAPPQKPVETITPSLHQSHKDGIATEHSDLAQTVELDEGTILHCAQVIEGLRLDLLQREEWEEGREFAYQDARANLLNLLPDPPKKDRAKELVTEYMLALDRQYFDIPDGLFPVADEYNFARWLESEGKLR